MDRPRLSISLAHLLSPQHSLGSPIFLGLALSLTQGIPLESHYPQKSGIFCFLVRSLGSGFFQHTLPFLALERRVGWLFCPGGRGVGW